MIATAAAATHTVGMRRAALLGLALCACQSTARAPLGSAGSTTDEGHGELARASARLLTSDDPEATPLPAPRRDTVTTEDESAMYAGTTYGNYVAPAWTYPSTSRQPSYQPRANLTGAIEGTITWRGPAPKLTTACGEVAPITLGPQHGLAGAVVYIDQLVTGRITTGNGDLRPLTVGGTVVKRGCMLLPTTQVVAPVPAQLTINGDASAIRVRVHAVTQALQAGGRIALPLVRGTTVVEAEDGSLGAAFVLGVTTPAFAVTDEAGRFRIDELAPGTYEVTVWQAPVPKLEGKKLIYGQPIVTHRSVTVVDRRTTRLDAVLGGR